uniref:discoidin domain-containing protein n=6 Tax=Ligaoa zhengdingensis TaxID=2763658 RepID=UPI0031BA09C9
MKKRLLQATLAIILAAQLAIGGSVAVLAEETTPVALQGESSAAVLLEPTPAEPPSEEIPAESSADAQLPALLNALPEDKEYVPVSGIAAVTASSYQGGYEPEKAVDGIEDDPNNCWHSPWEGNPPTFPHWLQVEFDQPRTIDSLVYVARSATGFQFVTEYEVWVSPTADEADLDKVAEGTWTRAKTAAVEFLPESAVLVRFVAKAKVDSNKNDTYSVSASEIKFGLSSEVPGAYNDKILERIAHADRVLAYATDIGSGAHQFKQDAWDALDAERDALEALLDTADVDAIFAQLDAVQTAIETLLASNMTDGEDLVVDLPKAGMSASSSSENAGYEADKAIDGDASTIWHTQWDPENTPHPHSLIVDLGRSVMIDKVSITPRQDMKTGKITSGEVYVGDDPEQLELAATFSASSGYDASVVPLGDRQAQYLEIRSLASTSANTAVAEVDVSIYDRGYVALMDAYGKATQFLLNAQAGAEVGQYPQAAIDSFTAELDGFAAQLGEAVTPADCYALAGEIENARIAFADQVNRYQRGDLNALIAEAEGLLTSIENEQDKAFLATAIASARSVAENSDSTTSQIHQAAVELKSALDALRFAGAERYDLSGKWDFYLGAYQAEAVLEDTVTLPGTLDENKKGSVNTYRDPGRLSRYYTYTGPATYQREVFIPNSWQGKQVSLFMERSRETRVWVNGSEVLSPETTNVMATSQVYDLTAALTFGQLNTITIVVDNSYPNTPRAAITTSSMATEETQTNWNGIVGRFELQIDELVNIDDLRVYPNDDLKTATVQVDVKNSSAEDFSGEITLEAPGMAARKLPVAVAAGTSATVSLPDYDMGADVKLWSEFEQNLYTMSASLDNGSTVEEQFGMRVFGVDPETKQLTNNGDKVFLRSEANCAVFPLTAYAPMDEAGWEKLFSTYQSFGINAVRFHSWCPPEAAFAVADRMGLFLQPELSCWDAGSMFDGPVEKDYYTKEAKAIVKEYANHPSFVMLTFGNELVFAGGGYEFADQLLAQLKEQDATRLYSFASNAGYGGTAPTAHSEFFTGQVYRGTSMRGIYAGMSGFINQQYPSTTVNHNNAIQRAANEAGIPAFSFEVGQFQVFPDVLGELDDYTGVLDPRNLQLVDERLDRLDISDEMTEKFINASGMLSRIGYRMEIEAALRTKHMSGISLLGIQDFSGQSTALVGMMNALGDAKPYDFATPAEFATFFSPEVALLETERFSWTNAETFTGKLLLANYGPDDLTGAMFYRLTDQDGNVLAEDAIASATFPQGDVTAAGTISIPLSGIAKPSQLKLTIGLGEVTNHYDLWVYPAGEKADEGEVYVTEFLNEEALYILEDGGKVLLSPKVNKSTLPNSITGTFTTAFWSSQFVSESQPGSMGLLMNPEHPVFDGFPTEYHSNYQWWAMAKLGRPMILESFTHEDGAKIEPLVQVLDSFSTIRTMGLLYEAKVGEGKLMVSSMGLEQLQNQYPEARALRNSILNYMNSDAFDPQFTVEVEQVQASVVGTETKPRVNLAEKSNGGEIFLGENTHTCQEGYDNDPQDRKLELNDGRVDVEVGSRSWTDWSRNGYPYDAEVGAILNDEYIIDTVVLPFFEDYGCKAPKSIKVQVWNGEAFVDVTNPSMTTGFVKGNNTITFDPVSTSQILLTMEHQPEMGIALSEFIVYEHEIPAESLEILPEGGNTSVELGETLQMSIRYLPENANDTDVRWTVQDADGNKSKIATITLGGLLKPKAAGTVVVKAALRSNPEVSATIEITILNSTSGVDKTALKALIAAVDGKYDETRYTAASWKALTDALNAAKAVVADVAATESQVFDAYLALVAARDGLTYAPDKSLLTLAVEIAEDLLKDESLTAATKEALQVAVNSAKAVLDNADATQAEINAEYEAVMTRITELVKADKTLLRQLIAMAEELKEGNYRPSSWANLQAVLTEAKAVEANGNATEAMIAEACSKLT